MRKVVLAAAFTLSLTGCAGQEAGTPVSTPDNGGAAAASDQTGARPSTPDTPTPVKVCELVTQAEADALAGTPLDPGQEGPPENPQCTYVGPPSGPVAQVRVFVGDGAKKFYDIDRGLGHEFTPLSGVGDEAWAEINTVFFREATTWAGIELTLLNDPEANREPLAALARTFADRL